MREDVGYTVKGVSDRAHAELSPDEVLGVFTDTYVNITAPLTLEDYRFVPVEGGMRAELRAAYTGETRELSGVGNGRLDAVANAIREGLGIRFSDLTYEEHALTKGSTSKAITYVSILADGKKVWGAGIHDDIIASSVNALISAVNRSLKGDK